MLEFGDVRIHLINDGVTLADPGGPFGLVPRVLYSRYFVPDENFLVPMSLHCLLIQVAGKNIVVDTGLGNKLDAKQQAQWHLTRPTGNLLDALSRLDVSANDIDIVIDTHLHSDHCSGNTYLNLEDGTAYPTFPNAQYVVQRREFEDASNPNERTAGTYYNINWQSLLDNGQLQLLDGDTEIAPGIFGVVTPGHTPGHMSVHIESNGQHALFACDMASYAVHFERLAWMTAYDVEPLVTLETKRQWQQWAFDHRAVVIFPHDPKRPAGKLTKDERNKFKLAQVELPYA